MAGYRALVVLDNSAWARILLGTVTGGDWRRWEDAVLTDEVLVCPPFELEALYSATDARSYAELRDELNGFRYAPGNAETNALALDAQAALAAEPAVSHRVKPVDLLVAAIAHQAGASVLHSDSDYDVIADHTALRARSMWIVPRGSVD